MTLVFTPWLYGVKVPRGRRRTVCRSQSSHEDLEDLAGLVGKQAVVGQDDRGPAAGLEDGQHVLDEVELLVAGRDGEVVALGAWFAPLVPNGGLVSTTSNRGALGRLVDGVAERDVRLEAVEVEVHQGQAARAGDEVLPEVGLGLDALGQSRSNAPPFVCFDAATRRRPPGSRRCRRPGRRS